MDSVTIGGGEIGDPTECLTDSSSVVQLVCAQEMCVPF